MMPALANTDGRANSDSYAAAVAMVISPAVA